MGKIETDHTGSGGGITLSSDGTSLLLDGTAIGGSPDLYAENYDGTSTLPSATGTNAVAIGKSAVASGSSGFASGNGATASGANSVALGRANTASGSNSFAFGFSNTASATYSVAIHGNATADETTAIGRNSSGQPANAVTGQGAMALGGSYASGADSFAAAIANNTSSYGATGSNSVAMVRNSKASGSDSLAFGRTSQATTSYAVAMGYNCLSAASYAVALGYQAQATGNNAFAAGASSTYQERANATASGAVALGGAYANGTDSVAIGASAKSTEIGKISFSNDKFSAVGDSQGGLFILRADTTGATAEALTTNNSTAATTNQVVLPNNSVYGFTGTITARENSAATNDFAIWEVKGGAVRGSSASTTALGSYNINTISESTGAANWSIAISADTTNGAIAFTVTGEAVHQIRWVATINTTEVIY
tara:strand:+ start:5986 stop:7266 length:1281 start_codon:yes stop_codon:yes gene_type:complete